MNRRAVARAPSPIGADGDAPAPGRHEEANLAELAGDWLKSSAGALGSSFRLAVAEAKLAAMSLVLMLFLTVLAAIFALGAWGLLLSGLVVVLEGWGVPLWASLAGLGLAQVLAAAALFRAVLRLGRRLELAETNHRLERALGGGEKDDDR